MSFDSSWRLTLHDVERWRERLREREPQALADFSGSSYELLDLCIKDMASVIQGVSDKECVPDISPNIDEGKLYYAAKKLLVLLEIRRAYANYRPEEFYYPDQGVWEIDEVCKLCELKGDTRPKRVVKIRHFEERIETVLSCGHILSEPKHKSL